MSIPHLKWWPIWNTMRSVDGMNGESPYFHVHAPQSPPPPLMSGQAPPGVNFSHDDDLHHYHHHIVILSIPIMIITLVIIIIQMIWLTTEQCSDTPAGICSSRDTCSLWSKSPLPSSSLKKQFNLLADFMLGCLIMRRRKDDIGDNDNEGPSLRGDLPARMWRSGVEHLEKMLLDKCTNNDWHN